MASTQRDLSTGQAAKLLRCSQQTVIRACDEGLIDSYRLPASKFRRIPKAALLDYMKANNIPIGWEEQQHPGANVAEAACDVEVN